MLEFSVTPGKTFEAGEKVDNDKLNLLGEPSIETSGGLENIQARMDAWFYITDRGSAANVYVGQLDDAEQDPATLSDGMVVAFKIPVANTGPSTFQARLSDGTALTAAAIHWRGRALAAGDLVANRIYELRWEAVSGTWQLMAGGGIAEGDITPGPSAWGANNGSTATAWVMQFNPAPAALAAGLTVRLAAPATNGAGVTMQIQDTAATPNNIGGAIALQRVGRLGTLIAVSAGDLVAGQTLELIYNGTVWVVVNGATLDAAAALSNGLVVQNNTGTPGSKVDIAASELMLYGSPGTSVRTLVNATGTVDIAVAGLNGLDTGAPAADTWYFIWAVFNVGSDQLYFMFSASATAPTLPANVTHRALVGAVYRRAAVFDNFYQLGRQVWLRPTTIFTGQLAAASNTYETLAGANLTAFRTTVPTIARSVSGYAGLAPGSGTGADIGLAADANGLGEVLINAATSTSFAGTAACGGFRLPVLGQNLWWKCVNMSQTNLLVVSGWEW